MPDKYGFETKEDRAQQQAQQQREEDRHLERRMRLFGQYEEKIQDILEHYMRAYELDSAHNIANYSQRLAWAIGPLGAAWDDQPLRVIVVVAHPDTDPCGRG